MELNTTLVERLFRYYQVLLFQSFRSDSEIKKDVSSRFIGAALQIDATQVRKDLAAIGIKGRQKVGYKTDRIIKKIGSLVGLKKERKGIVIGAGRLGGAISSDRDFPLYGINIVALFDIDSKKTGSKISGKTIYPLKKLKVFVKKHHILLGIITVPSEVAQETATVLVDAGIKAIWNFAHKKISVPRGVYVHNECIATGFAGISYFLKHSSR